MLPRHRPTSRLSAKQVRSLNQAKELAAKFEAQALEAQEQVGLLTEKVWQLPTVTSVAL